MTHPTQSLPRQSWLPWVIGYIAIMGVGLAVTLNVFQVAYATPYFAFAFLPWMIVLAVYTAYVARRNRIKLGTFTSSPAAYAWLSPWIFLEIIGMSAVAMALYTDSQAILSVAIVAVMTGLVGYAEETMFRGVALQGMLRNGNSPLLAAFVSAVLFSALHAVNVLGGLSFSDVLPQLWHTLLFGLALAPIAVLTRTLMPLMLIHAVWDFVLLSSLNAPVSPEAIDRVQGLESFFVIAVGVIAWIVLYRRRGSLTVAD